MNVDVLPQGAMIVLARPRSVPEMGGHAALGAQRLRIQDLHEGDSARGQGLDHDHVRLLAGAGTRLPPIIVHHPVMRVIDGMHRLAAARLNGQTHIEAQLFHGTRDEAFRLGVEANVAHGLPLSLADRRAAAARIVESAPTLADRSVARMTGLSATTVAAIRARVGEDASETRVGADGRSRPLTAVAGRIAASQFIARFPGATVREIAREAGISVGTAHDVRRRVLAGEQPQSPPAPHTAPRQTAARQHGPATAKRDLEQILDTLRQDPVLRYSDSGRVLLRWLGRHAVSIDDWREAQGAVPAHCLEQIASFAEECAKRWSAVAAEISSA